MMMGRHDTSCCCSEIRYLGIYSIYKNKARTICHPASHLRDAHFQAMNGKAQPPAVDLKTIAIINNNPTTTGESAETKDSKVSLWGDEVQVPEGVDYSSVELSLRSSASSG